MRSTRERIWRYGCITLWYVDIIGVALSLFALSHKSQRKQVGGSRDACVYLRQGGKVSYEKASM